MASAVHARVRQASHLGDLVVAEASDLHRLDLPTPLGQTGKRLKRLPEACTRPHRITLIGDLPRPDAFMLMRLKRHGHVTRLVAVQPPCLALGRRH